MRPKLLLGLHHLCPACSLAESEDGFGLWALGGLPAFRVCLQLAIVSEVDTKGLSLALGTQSPATHQGYLQMQVIHCRQERAM